MADLAQLMYSMLAGMEKHTELIDELHAFCLYLAGSLKYGAAQWYIVKKDDVKSVEDFFEKLEEEFVPPDLQERLRDQMNDLKER
ncbi:Tc1like transporase [Phytophthora palmivora]|uniref:Tc1like transporase n=1 Tax=Phytophthora palmivora TaxID=4796 RepID=A0A2P4WZH2_9STRA|nr:Tc1like transporase [Phytophthora palmivora]